MNIVIIPAFFQTKQRPTLGSFFLEQAIALQKNGHKVTILYCDTYSIKCAKEWLHYQEEPVVRTQEGILIYRNKCFCPRKHGIEGHKEAFAKGIERLYEKYASGSKIDVIHAHCCVWAGYVAMRLAEKIGVPYIVTEHATLFQLHKNEISNPNNKVIKQVFRKAAKVICVSRAFGKLLEEYTDNMEVIGNVVNCERFTVANTEKKENAYRFLTVCYMEEEAQLYKKGLDVLIRAWAKVAPQYPQAKLLIGGGGKAKEKVVQWAEENKMSDRIEFLGALTREQVKEQMQLCDCFVLPSRYETFGVVYIEAFACGKPVIAAKNGGPDDFVKEFNGLLVEPEKEDELTQALIQMIETDKAGALNYQPDRIAAYVEEQFSYEAIAKRLEKVYADVMKQLERE